MVEVLHILLHDPVQMSFAQNQDVVEALAPQAAEEAFAYGVRLRCFVWCLQHLDSCGRLLERISILVVIVPDQESWFFPKWRGFAQLLGYPRVRWVSRDAKMDHTARAQLDDNEHKYCTEEDVVCLKKVAGPNLAGVVAQERSPVLA